VSFEPIFVFDSREQWFPVGVEESLDAVNARCRGGIFNGHRAEPARPFPPGVTNIDFPANMKQPDLPPVGYHRVVQSGPLWWHQYWLWYLYNPWSVAGVGRHEGDWEFVQIGCVNGNRPVLVTASQHHSGGKREAWAVELREGRPVIYVALGSHANYFNVGSLGGGIDQCDGRGRVLDSIEWREFGPWKDGPWRWGNSTGEGKSPESPGRQGKRWHAPHLFHSEAK
jgi:hypothetical protein